MTTLENNGQDISGRNWKSWNRMIIHDALSIYINEAFEEALEDMRIQKKEAL